MAYGVVAWLLIQVVSIVFEPLGFPGWALTLVIVLIALGFPITLAISWFYEWTTKGLKTQKDAEAKGTEKPQSFGRLFDFVVIALLALAVSWFVYKQEFQTPDILDGSVAVLPFENLSDDPEQGFFTDGLTEALIGALSQNSDLKVAGKTSSFYFRGKNENFQKIGEILGVKHILEGSVRRSGDRIRITSQLINAEDGFQLWSETYDREFKDIFAIEDEISIAVSTALNVKILGAPTTNTSNAEAYALYIAAATRVRQRGRENLETAIELLYSAIGLDPEFGDALGLLGYAKLLFFANHRGIERETALAEAKPLFAKAIKLAPGSSIVQVGFSFFLGLSGDFENARKTLLMALSLDPTNTEALVRLGISYNGEGDEVTSLFYLNKGLELDPVSSHILYWKALVLMYDGRLEEAKPVALKHFELYPKAGQGPELLARIARYQGDLASEIKYSKAHAGNVPENYFVHLVLIAALTNVNDRQGIENAWINFNPKSDIGNFKEIFRALNEKSYSLAINLFGPEKNTFINHLKPYFLPELLVSQGRYSDLIDWEKERRPILFGPNPGEAIVNQRRSFVLFEEALLVALALREEGNSDQSQKIIEASRERLFGQIEQDFILENTHHRNVLLLASLGDKEGAIFALQELFQSGWRNFWSTNEPGMPTATIRTALFFDSPLLDDIRDDQRFQEVVGKYKKSIQEFRQNSETGNS